LISFRKQYIIPLLLAVAVAFLSIFSLFSSEDYWKACIAVALPSIVLYLGHVRINNQRKKAIIAQLENIIQTLEAFDMDEPKKVNFEPSDFPIFNELNEYLLELIDRIRSIYHANKQFTQNATHELQTPLAIITGNAELLLQSSNIRKKESEAIVQILQNANRLSKINQALILLSKIENQRFADTQPVNFSKVTDEVLQNFEDLIKINGLSIRKVNNADMIVTMSHSLAHILIANLLQNAIRHNIENGFIEIVYGADEFLMTNPGEELKTPPEGLFKRFRKQSSSEESLGLGAIHN
jgi:signal transduction histidine kinase